MHCSGYVALLALVGVVGCGAGAGASAAGGGGANDARGAAGTCVERQHLTSAELAQSPRGDRDLEVLAAALGGTVAADPAIYARLARDVAAIRAAEPSLTTVTYRTGHDGRTLMLEFGNTDARDRILAGHEPTFEALRPRLAPIAVNLAYSWVVVGFERVYDLVRLREYYRRISGVSDVGLNVMAGGGPSMCVERDDDDAAWTYWVLDAGGDCPAGCTTMRVFGFRTAPSGALERLGASDTETAARLDPASEAALQRCVDHARERAARPTEVCDALLAPP